VCVRAQARKRAFVCVRTRASKRVCVRVQETTVAHKTTDGRETVNSIVVGTHRSYNTDINICVYCINININVCTLMIVYCLYYNMLTYVIIHKL